MKFKFLSAICAFAGVAGGSAFATDWNGDNRFKGDVTVGLSATPYGNLTLNGKGGSGAIFSVRNGATSTLLFNVLPSGNTGIGTSAPSYTLEVIGTIRALGPIIASGTDSSFQIGRRDNNASVWAAYSNAGEFGLWDYVSGVNRVTILNSGNVGVGTDAPGSRLHVNGTAALGTGVTSAASDQVVVGKYNDTRTNDNGVNHTQGVFVVGAGTGASTKVNAIRVLADGTVLVKPAGDIGMGSFTNGPTP